MILLTGGTGLIGRHTLAALRQLNRPVLAVARSPQSATALRETGAEVLEGSVDDPATWQRIDNVSAIIHAAASVFTRSTWEEYHRVNVEATRMCAERARALGVPLIHISSVAVYNVVDHYSRSKQLAEDAVWREAERGLRTIVLRPCVVYGEGDRLFLPKLVRVAQRGWFPVLGNGQAPLPLVYAGNVAEGVVAALDATAGWGQPFNLTNDGVIAGNDLVMGLAKGLQRQVRARRIPMRIARTVATVVDLLRPVTRSHLPPLRAGVAFLGGGNAYSSADAVDTLGWRPTHRHSAALPRAVRWVAEGK